MLPLVFAVVFSAFAEGTRPGEFDGYSVLPAREVRTLDAFGDQEFEGRGEPCFKAKEGVSVVPG